MQVIGEVEVDLWCIPKTIEQYIVFSLGHLRFLGSYRFLSLSLQKLVKACPKKEFRQRYEGNPGVELLLRKGVYPCDRVYTLFYRFDEMGLQPIQDFYSTLTKKHISQEDYSHAVRVWDDLTASHLGTTITFVSKRTCYS